MQKDTRTFAHFRSRPQCPLDPSPALCMSCLRILFLKLHSPPKLTDPQIPDPHPPLPFLSCYSSPPFRCRAPSSFPFFLFFPLFLLSLFLSSSVCLLQCFFFVFSLLGFAYRYFFFTFSSLFFVFFPSLSLHSSPSCLPFVIFHSLSCPLFQPVCRHFSLYSSCFSRKCLSSSGSFFSCSSSSSYLPLSASSSLPLPILSPFSPLLPLPPSLLLILLPFPLLSTLSPSRLSFFLFFHFYPPSFSNFLFSFLSAL